jgi:isochorismate pyruvate lyase
MKSPQECQSIQEVRECIDTIDNQIIELIAQRFEYVKAVVPFKEKTVDAIIAKERKDQVLRERRELAQKHGLNPDAIEEMYKLLIQYFIEEEMQLLDNHK